jgi:Asp-tRNA(Asn)/Glu-tRNA(Gln) amidotransferase A subunit family amidase
MAALFELGARRAADAVRKGEQTAEALAEALLARCAAASALNAFISLEADRLRAAARADPPPLKWSDLRYVFDIKEDCNGKEAIQA